MADQLQNMLAELVSRKQESIDSQIFTYTFRVYVPNKSFHPTQNFPWPGNTPGKARLKFRCEEDANFKIEAVTASVHGPVRWTDNVQEADQVDKPDAQGATVFPLPGFSQPLPLSAYLATASSVTDLITVAAGGGPWKTGMPVIFSTTGNGVLPSPLVKNRIYYNDVNAALAFAVTGNADGTDPIDLTDAGTAPFYASLPSVITNADVGTNVITLDNQVLFTVGQPISFYATFPNDTLPAPLVNDTPYYAIPQAAGQLKLALTPQDAIAGTEINLTTTGTAVDYALYAYPKADIAERGVSARIYEKSNVEKNLTNDYVPMELLFPPAYGTYIAQIPSVLEGHILPKAHELILDFRNRDIAGGNTDVSDEEVGTNGDWYHVVHIAFTGRLFYD